MARFKLYKIDAGVVYRWRSERLMSQRKLADLAHLGAKAVCDIERGKFQKGYRAETVQKLAAAMGLPWPSIVSEVIEGEGSELARIDAAVAASDAYDAAHGITWPTGDEDD